jgi:hypothetical protein
MEVAQKSIAQIVHRTCEVCGRRTCAAALDGEPGAEMDAAVAVLGSEGIIGFALERSLVWLLYTLV